MSKYKQVTWGNIPFGPDHVFSKIITRSDGKQWIVYKRKDGTFTEPEEIKGFALRIGDSECSFEIERMEHDA